MRALVRTALERRTTIAVPAGVLAQVWRGSARQVAVARLIRSTITEVVPLDQRSALAVGKLCARTGAADVVDVSVALCARERGHPVVTSDPGDLRAIDPTLTLVPPG
jgi:predicted nucleic acid-binding protein